MLGASSHSIVPQEGVVKVGSVKKEGNTEGVKEGSNMVAVAVAVSATIKL